VHGLENIVYLSDEQIRETAGDPIALQDALNKVEPTGDHHASVEASLAQYLGALDDYKREIGRHNFAASDRKKMLAMPFALRKRVQLPEPKKGQHEWEMFSEWAGAPWDAYANVEFDLEEKITEFEYEKFIPKQILATMDTESQEFKNYVKMLNLKTRTSLESHKDKQEQFKQLMPLFAGLSIVEKDDLMHTLENQQNKWAHLEDLVNKKLEK